MDFIRVWMKYYKRLFKQLLRWHVYTHTHCLLPPPSCCLSSVSSTLFSSISLFTIYWDPVECLALLQLIPPVSFPSFSLLKFEYHPIQRRSAQIHILCIHIYINNLTSSQVLFSPDFGCTSAHSIL